MDPIRLTNDFVFRYVFGRRESEPILLDLVNAEKEDTDMSTLLSKNPNLERAYEEYQRCTQDRELRELALARERYLRDQASRIGSARREGIVEGKRRQAMETASRLLSMGMSVSQVATATGLGGDEVRELKQGDEDARRTGEPSGR
jgi:predicted transposase/invertase (TIGR01784 family)